MNREIKFRGKRVDNGEWVYGGLVNSFEGTHIVASDYFKPSNDQYPELINVDGSTVGQYTGLKDKNRVEIYENDFVKVNGTKRTGKYISSVVWHHSGFRLLENKTYLKDGFILPIMVEVIGNVHDNPELLTLNNQQ